MGRHSDQRLGWILNDQPGALAKARQTGKLVLIDFTGYTCTNCRWMESNIFGRPDVAAALDRYVLSRLYTDGQGRYTRSSRIFRSVSSELSHFRSTQSSTPTDERSELSRD